MRAGVAPWGAGKRSAATQQGGRSIAAGPVSLSFAYVEMAKKADAIKAVEAARAEPFVLRGRTLAVVRSPAAPVRMRRRSSP